MLLVLFVAACAPTETPLTDPRGAAAPATAALASAESASEQLPSSEALEASPLLLNELMASNDSVLMDENIDLDDWVEVVNRSSEVVALAGWGLSEDDDEASWTFAEDASLAPGERLIVWLDDEPEEGDLHATFRLDEDEGSLTLWQGETAMDQLSWEDLGSDIVLGRFPDASANVVPSVRATPYNANPWDPGTSLDPSDAIFDHDRVLTFELWLPDESRAALDNDPYTYVEAGLGFEGVWLEPVGVRIKGQWGSLRTLDSKAALKINLDWFVEGQRLRGLEGLTLNNMVQDASAIHERIAYTIFRDAGVPAPRTSHVALYLNGEYRGLYTNLETMDDSFLERWYEDEEGNLYEGAYGQDLTSGSYTSLELDQDGASDVEPYSELAELAALLDQTPDEALVDELEALVDVDEVLRMWAVEVLIGHWDGYFYYPNNYRIYHDPSTGLLSLLPWGTDQTFAWTGGIDSTAGYLATWCLSIPSIKVRYQLALWDVADRMRSLDLARDATAAWEMILPWLESDPYREATVEDGRYYYEYTLTYLEAWPAEVVAEIFPEGEPELE